MAKKSEIQVQQPTMSVEMVERMNIELNSEPNPEWIKTHPYIKNYKYLDIGTIEFLLKKYFKHYKIEILREGTAFNGVYVVVRIWYFHPVTGTMEYHDGIGSEALQTKSGSSPADLANINTGALTMAFPKAKSTAIKNAAKNFGRLFGSDLNDLESDSKNMNEPLEIGEVNFDELSALFDLKKDVMPSQHMQHAIRILETKDRTSYRKLFKYLRNL